MNKNHEFYHIMPAIPENMNLTRLSIFCLNCKYNNIRLWHRTVLAALRGAYSFAPAQAAIFIAVKAARVPHGPAAVVRRRRSLTNSDSRAKASCAHGRRTYAFAKLRFTRLRALRTMSVNAASRRNGHGPDDLIKALHWERRRHDARLMGYSRFHQNGIPLAFQEATVRSS